MLFQILQQQHTDDADDADDDSLLFLLPFIKLMLYYFEYASKR